MMARRRGEVAAAGESGGPPLPEEGEMSSLGPDDGVVESKAARIATSRRERAEGEAVAAVKGVSAAEVDAIVCQGLDDEGASQVASRGVRRGEGRAKEKEEPRGSTVSSVSRKETRETEVTGTTSAETQAMSASTSICGSTTMAPTTNIKPTISFLGGFLLLLPILLAPCLTAALTRQPQLLSRAVWCALLSVWCYYMTFRTHPPFREGSSPRG